MTYNNLNQQLQQAQIGLNATELQGFITGLICGNASQQSWLSLLYQFTNDNHAYPSQLLTEVSALYEQIKSQLSSIDSFEFELLMPETDDIYQRVDALSEWANHFLLALGLTQPNLDKETGEIGEGIDDLQDICQLGYDEDDNPEELADALEEVIEYVRTLATLFYTHFNPLESNDKPTLH